MNNSSRLLEQFTDREKFMFLCGFSSGNMQGMLSTIKHYEPDKVETESKKISDNTNQILEICNEKLNLNIKHTEQLDYGLLELTDEINEIVVSLVKQKDETKKSLFDLEHTIIKNGGNPLVVCIGHFCELDGISEDKYLQLKQEKQ